MGDRERQPLLPSSNAARRKQLAPSQGQTRRTNRRNRLTIQREPNLQDYAIGLHAQLTRRGYDSNLVVSVEQDGESEEEVAIRSKVNTFLGRYQTLFDQHLPNLSIAVEAAERTSSTSHAGAEVPALESVEGADSEGGSSKLIGTMLLYLITLYSAGNQAGAEASSGIGRELNDLKARNEVRRKVIELVRSLLDSSLTRVTDDIKIPTLFVGLPGSSGSTTSCLELLLRFARIPSAERAAEKLLSHPVVLAETENVWYRGIVAPGSPSPSRPAFLRGSLAQAYSSITPRLLHRQHYIVATLHALLTVYILLFSFYGESRAFNPLSPRYSWSASTTVVWYTWVASSLGWFGDSIYADWKHLRSGNSWVRSALLSPFQHTLVAVSIFLRFLLLFPLDHYASRSGITSTSLLFLASSVPFLAAARLLPHDLPNFGSPTQFDWNFRRPSPKGYQSPPRTIPDSHGAVEVLDRRFGGLAQSLPYLFGFVRLLFWGIEDDFTFGTISTPVVDFVKSKTTPYEARLSMAATIFTMLFISLFSGSTNTITTRSPPTDADPLRDLDQWETLYGSSVAFKSRRERLSLVNHFTYIYSKSNPPDKNSPYTVQPPLCPPLNLFIPILEFGAFTCRLGDRREWGNKFRERGRKIVWMVGALPLMVLWAIKELGSWLWRWGKGDGRD